MAQKKAATKKKFTQQLSRGGETFNVEKSADTFVVKRPSHGAGGGASAAPKAFDNLAVTSCPGRSGLELCRAPNGTSDQAMEALRKDTAHVAWCGHVYHMPNDSDGLLIPSDSIYVELAEGARESDVNSLLDKHGLELTPDPGDVANAFILRLTSASKENPLKIANALLKSKAVAVAEPDLIAIARPCYRPSDTLFPRQWHLENRGGFGLTAGADVKAPQAWDITRGDRSIIVAVIDDGVDTGHPDFASAGKIVAPKDFGQKDENANPVSVKDNHGTACSGVAVADENGRGVVGLAPNCRLMPIRWSMSISDQDIREQFDHARLNGADVISCSWGVTAKFFTLSTSMKRSIHRAATEGRDGRGCVILFAAGNSNRDIDDPAGGTRDGFAIHPDVIAVAASNSRDRRSDYSNFGDAIWVCAPSSGAGGWGIITTDRRGSAGYQSGDYTTEERFGGTSSATPLVAGLCGLILSVNPELSAEEVKEILKATAVRIDPANGGYDANGHSRWFGYGRVDAFEALKAAQTSLGPQPSIRTVQFESRPNVDIPDNHPGGVSDSINVAESGTVASVRVDVRVNHTYRGDLKLQLTGPNDETVTLFGRTHPAVDGRDNLVATFTADNVPDLSRLTGKSAQGVWTLRVSDLAAADLGRLESWDLTLGVSSRQTEWTTAPGLHLPDADARGVTSQLDVTATGTLRDIRVEVDITHTYRGDLKLLLETPGGVSVTLKSVDNNDGQDNLRVTYTPTDSPGLRTLIEQGVSIAGAWKLNVSDNLGQDLGKLNSWRLRLTS